MTGADEYCARWVNVRSCSLHAFYQDIRWSQFLSNRGHALVSILGVIASGLMIISSSPLSCLTVDISPVTLLELLSFLCLRCAAICSANSSAHAAIGMRCTGYKWLGMCGTGTLVRCSSNSVQLEERALEVLLAQN